MDIEETGLVRRRKEGFVSDALIQLLPKTDLHMHLDGSIRISTLIELAQKYNVKLPAYTVEGLKETVFKENYESLPDYLQGFMYTDAVMQTTEAVERVSYELACDNFDDGVRYFEVRFAPHLHCNDSFSITDVCRSVNAGLQRAKAEYNARPQIVSGEEPPYQCAIILVAMRFFTANFSEYFKRLYQVHDHESDERLFELASSSLARTAVFLRDEGLPIVALDIAGAEAGFPARTHKEAFEYAHAHFLRKTVHAGEEYGPESIFQAINYLHANRVGHGTNIFRDDLIKDPNVKDKALFCSRLANHFAEKGLHVEVCLKSNSQTRTDLRGNLKDHPLLRMLASHMSLSLNTDNRTVSDTTVTKEIITARDTFNLTPANIRHLVIGGFKASFYPGTHLEKHAYVAKIVQFYDKLDQEDCKAAAAASE